VRLTGESTATAVTIMLGERLDRVRSPQKETVRNAEFRLLLKSVGVES
jgi:hypothetical protein